jgi:hypothetical protein
VVRFSKIWFLIVCSLLACKSQPQDNRQQESSENKSENFEKNTDAAESTKGDFEQEQSTQPLSLLTYKGACTVYRNDELDYCSESYFDDQLREKHGYTVTINAKNGCDYYNREPMTSREDKTRSEWSAKEKCKKRASKKGCRHTTDADVTVIWRFLEKDACKGGTWTKG